MPLSASEAYVKTKKIQWKNVTVSIKPGTSEVWHSHFWANLAFACRTETSVSLYSHVPLIPTKSSKFKDQVVQVKIPKVAHARLAQKGEVRLELEVPGSILNGGNNLHWFFLFPWSKASDANNDIIVNFVCFVKTRLWACNNEDRTMCS